MNASVEIDHRYAEELQGAAVSLGQLLIWIIYDHPADYPDWFVARPSIIRPKTGGPVPMHLIAKDLNMLRALLPDGLTCLGRQTMDDPAILEVWV
jgi:hypothetical protein